MPHCLQLVQNLVSHTCTYGEAGDVMLSVAVNPNSGVYRLRLLTSGAMILRVLLTRGLGVQSLVQRRETFRRCGHLRP